MLVIGAETLSRITDYKDRGSCILFGDGAGAVVLQRTQRHQARPDLQQPARRRQRLGDALTASPAAGIPIDEAMLAERQQYMKIKGREVYKFAVQRFEELIEDAMRKCELTADEVKLIVPHQVNQRIIDIAMEKLDIAAGKGVREHRQVRQHVGRVDPDRAGRSVARRARSQQGDVVIFVAFGAGLTWANAVVRM